MAVDVRDEDGEDAGEAAGEDEGDGGEEGALAEDEESAGEDGEEEVNLDPMALFEPFGGLFGLEFEIVVSGADFNLNVLEIGSLSP